MTGHGAGAALSSTMLTLIVATAPGTRVTTRVASSTAAAGRYVVDITNGTTATPVTVNLSTGAIG